MKYVDYEGPSFYQLQENYTFLLKVNPLSMRMKIITGIPEIDDDSKLWLQRKLTLAGVGTTAAIHVACQWWYSPVRILNKGQDLLPILQSELHHQ